MVKRLVPEESLSAGFIWENTDKIVPALLFIMQESYLKGDGANCSGELCDANDEDAEMDHTLDRYLYGDFFIHSRTKENLANEEQSATGGSSDLDGVKVEFRKAISSTGPNNMSASNSDEAGTVFLVNRKNSVEVVDPDHEAKMLLKNLACKADYTTISKIVLPILNFLDANKPSGWEYPRFVRCIFLILCTTSNNNMLLLSRSSSSTLTRMLIRRRSLNARLSELFLRVSESQLCIRWVQLDKLLRYLLTCSNT